MNALPQNRTVLITGATGYIGGRLIHALREKPVRLRCLARRPAFLTAKMPAADVVQGDMLEPASLGPALAGVDTAYYLVHAMGSGSDFEENERRSARNFADAAKAAGVRRIVYLGALADGDDSLSHHLRSRLAVGDILRESGVPVIEFQASIVIGAGSLSYELIRALVERLPVMITPRWVRTPSQPIAIDDLLAYLVEALDLPLEQGGTFEIGGADVVSYGELMQQYAAKRGLRRVLIPVPVLTPYLSSLWLGLVTPVYARIGRHLIEGVRNPSVVRNHSAADVFAVRPVGVAEAIAQAQRAEDRELAATHWSDALSSSGQRTSWGGVQFGARLVDSRTADVPVPASMAFSVIERIGGATGWYYGDWLWQLRGALDLLAGGAGMRRGRRDLEHLRLGDTVDCWRVEALEPGRRLRLFAEMRLPGRAWLEFETVDNGAGTTIRQTSIFDPVGLAGIAYWYGLYPVHQLVFAGMLRGIAERATNLPKAADCQLTA